MKKIILSIAVVIMAISSVSAQSVYGDAVKADIKMKYVYSFEEALSLAKEKNKLIFFNCFADWALPCHGMNIKVFSNQEFANWMDDKFINFFIDVTKGDGKVLAKKYNTKTMAQYLVLDANGEVVHRIVGGSEIPIFQKLLTRALSPKTSLRGMTASYGAGNKKINFLKEYFEVLRTAGESDKAKIVLNEVFDKLDKKQWSKKENWVVFLAKMRTPDDEYFTNLVENKSKFEKSNGADNVEKAISKVFDGLYLEYALGGKTYEASKFLDYLLLMQKSGLSKNDNAYLMYEFAKKRGENNVQSVVDILTTKSSIWNPNLIRVIDLSLESMKDLSKEDRATLTKYWQARADTIQGTTANHYRNSIKRINSNDGIKFAEISFTEALAKAEKDKKLVFMDCFTTWCGPCKWLDNNTFRDKKVGDYFNANFINVKMDMEKGEGIQLGEKYGVKAFPTLLVLDAKGNVVNKIIGAVDSKEILEKVQKNNSSN